VGLNLSLRHTINFLLNALKIDETILAKDRSLDRMADDDDYVAPAMDDMEDTLDELVAVEGTTEEASKNDPLAVLLRHHPECQIDYAEVVAPRIPLTASPPLGKDPNHRSQPFLSKNEKTKILGMRANQLSQSARPYIAVPEYVTDVWEIARMELAARRLPFIIRRPMPDGTHEFWRLSDLLIL
jgi:DNA-directed RNA polymerase I, II, and III subunit RPABC2